MSNLKKCFQTVEHNRRAIDRLESMLGVKLATKRRLTRVSNCTWNGGRLLDGTGHYRNSWEFSGNTYRVKTHLRSAGFKWDSEHKVWYAPLNACDVMPIVDDMLRKAATGKI